MPKIGSLGWKPPDQAIIFLVDAQGFCMGCSPTATDAWHNTIHMDLL